MQVLAGLVPSSQTVGSLLRTPLLAKPARKVAKLYINKICLGNIFSTIKMMFANFAIW
jgi:hypothetical protein